MNTINFGRTLVWRLFALIFALLVSGCGTLHNTIKQGQDMRLMLTGNDPVAYFTEHKPIKGDPSIRAEHDGNSYRFVSDANRMRFLTDPVRYAPRYSGFCAAGAPYALKANIGASVFAIHKDRLYLFGSERSKVNWLMDADQNVVLGDRYWEEETKNVPSRLQNWKRYVFRVAHYKTDAELDREYFRRYGKLPPGAPPLKE